MSRGWESSNLPIGTIVKVSPAFFVDPEKAAKNLISATLVGEYPSGLLVDCVFQVNTASSMERTHHYRIFLNWASIWCGQSTLRTENDQAVRAYREQGMPTTEVI